MTLNYKNIKEHIAGTVLYKSSSNLCKWHSCLTQVSPARPCSAVIHAQRPLLALTLGFGHPLPPAAYLRSGLSYVAPIARHEEKMLFLCLDPGTLAHQQIFGVGPQISRNRGCSEAKIPLSIIIFCLNFRGILESSRKPGTSRSQKLRRTSSRPASA